MLPIRALHLRKIGEDPDRPLFPFFDEECNLRLKRRDFIAANPSDNLEPESSSPALLLSDGAVPVDALASTETMTHHALAEQKKDGCQRDYKHELSNSERGWLRSSMVLRIQVSCHHSDLSAKCLPSDLHSKTRRFPCRCPNCVATLPASAFTPMIRT